MATVQCNQFMEMIEPWMEGEHRPGAVAHLGDCDRCRVLLADLEAIRAAGRELAEAEVDPPERVWAAVRAQLESQGLIRRPGNLRNWFGIAVPALPAPALAGAYAALLLIGGVLVGSQTNNLNDIVWQDHTQVLNASLDTQFSAVEQDTVAGLHEHNPDVTAALNENLAMVDNYISLCKKSVREEPQNEMVRDYLYGAYQQKAELLATMAERGVTAQ